MRTVYVFLCFQGILMNTLTRSNVDINNSLINAIIDIQPNLNISRLVIDRVQTKIKITYNAITDLSRVPFLDHYNSFFIERIP